MHSIEKPIHFQSFVICSKISNLMINRFYEQLYEYEDYLSKIDENEIFLKN